MSALDCINQLLQRHSDDPFGVLREYGMQAELRQLLLEAFPERIPVTFTQPKTPGRFEWNIPPLTKRVQLEMKVCLRANEQVERGRTDLIVFRKGEPVELSCHGNGPGDIIASVRARDVAIAIETKASPSRTFEQCSKYARDLQRLLVQSEEGIQTFFVLLDKSHPRYGAAKTPKWSTRTVDMHEWANLLTHLPEVSIAETRPPQYKALATLCYLNNAGRPSHAFAWR